MGGLFKVIAQNKHRMIVESLTDKKRIPAYAHQQLTTLEDISIYTVDEDIPLKDIFTKISEKEKGGASIDPKSGSEDLKNYFTEILPDYDSERVYVSDIKKVLTWYNLLKDTEHFTAEPDTKDTEKPEEEPSASAEGDSSESTKKEEPAEVEPAKAKASEDK